MFKHVGSYAPVIRKFQTLCPKPNLYMYSVVVNSLMGMCSCVFNYMCNAISDHIHLFCVFSFLFLF